MISEWLVSGPPNPVGAQAIHPCDDALNDHFRADEVVGNFLAFDNPDFIAFRGQDHPAPAAAQHS